MRTRRHISLATLLAAAALAAGCGDDQPSADDARTAFRSAQSQLNDLGDSIGRELQAAQGRGDEAIQRAFDRLQEQGQDAAQRIDDIDVPADVAQERDALREAIERGNEELGDIVEAARSSDPEAAREAVTRLIADSQAIQRAREAFERALDEATR